MTGWPQSAQAAVIAAPAPDFSIRLDTVSLPELRPDEVGVKFVASTVNHVDLMVAAGSYTTPVPKPLIVGRDLVGEVVAVGSGVTTVAPGQMVWTNSMGYAGRQGTLAEYSAVPLERIYPLPADVAPLSAAVTLHGGATAYLGLVHHSGLQPGQTVFIGGAGGAVGSAAMQIALEQGATVVASANAADLAWPRDQGAAGAFDYRTPELAARIAEVAPQGVDIWWDTSGHHDLAQILPLINPGGQVLITANRSEPHQFAATDLYLRDVTVTGFALSNASVIQLAAAASKINQLLADQRLQVRIGQQLPWTQAQTAFDLVAEATVPGRIALTAPSDF